MVFRNNIFNPIYESGDKVTQDINPKCGQVNYPCPENSKKIRHQYVSLMVLANQKITDQTLDHGELGP